MYFVIILLVISVFISPTDNESFEQVKIKLNSIPLDININNNDNRNDQNSCSNNPDIIVLIYAPWRTYLTSSNMIYPYYPFYYNNYY